METVISRLNNAHTQQKNIVAIFDIDSTLFNVTPRNQDILNLYLKAYNLGHLSHNLKDHDWGVETFIKKIHSKVDVLQAKKFWKKHFFSGTFLFSDKLYKGAKELLSAFESIGAQIYYLTGRDNERMRAGTLKQLKFWNLPLKSNQRLITKGHKSLPDGAYKRSKIESIFKNYENNNTEFFFFDNEPVVLSHCIFENHKNYTPIFINSTHSNRMKPDPSWLSIDTHSYEDLFKHIMSLK